jgi:hypothetical protein
MVAAGCRGVAAQAGHPRGADRDCHRIPLPPVPGRSRFGDLRRFGGQNPHGRLTGLLAARPGAGATSIRNPDVAWMHPSIPAQNRSPRLDPCPSSPPATILWVQPPESLDRYGRHIFIRMLEQTFTNCNRSWFFFSLRLFEASNRLYWDKALFRFLIQANIAVR